MRVEELRSESNKERGGTVPPRSRLPVAMLLPPAGGTAVLGLAGMNLNSKRRFPPLICSSVSSLSSASLPDSTSTVGFCLVVSFVIALLLCIRLLSCLLPRYTRPSRSCLRIIGRICGPWLSACGPWSSACGAWSSVPESAIDEALERAASGVVAQVLTEELDAAGARPAHGHVARDVRREEDVRHIP